MRRLAITTFNDLRLQFRHKFYHVYAIITIIYITILRFLPLDIRNLILPVLIFSDPAMLGFYLVAAMVLFEKDARSLQGISVSPLRPREYILAKAISLSILSVLASIVLAIGARGFDVKWHLLIPVVGLTSMAYVFIGFMVAVSHKTFNTFLLSSMLAVSLLNLPLMGVFSIVNTPLFYLLPAHPAILLIIEAFKSHTNWGKVALFIALLIAWNVALLLFGEKQYLRYVKGD